MRYFYDRPLGSVQKKTLAVEADERFILLTCRRTGHQWDTNSRLFTLGGRDRQPCEHEISVESGFSQFPSIIPQSRTWIRTLISPPSLTIGHACQPKQSLCVSHRRQCVWHGYVHKCSPGREDGRSRKRSVNFIRFHNATLLEHAFWYMFPDHRANSKD